MKMLRNKNIAVLPVTSGNGTRKHIFLWQMENIKMNERIIYSWNSKQSVLSLIGRVTLCQIPPFDLLAF